MTCHDHAGLPRAAGARTAVLAVALALASGTGVAAAPATGAPAAAAETTIHVDCSRQSAGDGSQASPFNSIAQANGRTYAPGDTLAFASGTTCTGSLTPGAAAPPWPRSHSPATAPARCP
ncbi:hypothetical protein AB6O49_01415 [Streptomyces sp. SBR177]